MGRSVNLRAISDIIADVQAELERNKKSCIESLEQDAKELIQKIETNRQAFALMDAAGFDLNLPSWMKGGYYDIELGFFPSTKAGNASLAGKLNFIRRTLGSRLKKESQFVADAKKRHVKIKLGLEHFPGLHVYYVRKLPVVLNNGQKPKCRLVRERSTHVRLVCELGGTV